MSPTKATRGRKPDASSKSGKIRELLKSGVSPMDIAKKVGCTPSLVYNVKARLSGGTKTRGRPRKNAGSAVGGLDGLGSILAAVKNTQTDVGRYRALLERIGS